MIQVRKRVATAVIAVCFGGCSRGPSEVVPPYIDPDRSASEAIKLYDTNADGGLSQEELGKCPAVLVELKHYDADGNRSVTAQEIAGRIKQLQRHGVGLTRLNCSVTLNGRPLQDARVQFEPEPYLGTEIKPAQGTTNERGVAQVAIAPEQLPADQRDLKAVHYGTYKVRITHPTENLPARYNTETTLGYESRPGDPYASFELKLP